MQTWMEGYESDVEYTSGYYREQEPDLLNWCALTQGITPKDLSQGFTYCELGCGMGMTALIMAANYPQGQFYAVDFNPSHIAQARNSAAQAGLQNIVFLEKSFAELVEDPTLLPSCDFIALHGIFTWVSDENRQHIITLCQRHLNSAGMVYNSYNAKPGWSLGEPLQKLLLAAGKEFNGNSLQRFDHAVGMIKRLDALQPAFFKQGGASVQKRLASLETKDRHYLVHEYLHEGWRAFYFPEVAQAMHTAKLDYLGAATPVHAYARNLLPNAVKTLLADIKDRHTQELFVDVYLNTSFRSDIYTRGINGRLDTAGKQQLLNNSHWMLSKPAQYDDAALSVSLSTGKYSLNKALYYSVMDRLSSGGVVPFTQLAQGQKSFNDVMQTVLLLHHARLIQPHYGTIDPAPARRLNQVLLTQVEHIALPYARTHMRLKVFDARFYQAALTLQSTDQQRLAQQAYDDLTRQDMGITFEGKHLREQAMREHLGTLAVKWQSRVLPFLQQGGALD